ncbi:MFS general substrate transporter [Aspergillus homomorphus CBS 101889]|uniref:MFS general substrate transporter n=1 Tax=Aspergillus homomorphus (strain CBS 101889) TaxID=1450537 RepID=A0A395IBE7_ASPHC|nr:MFS general substrate transporter [Aspergillus homomorphus CBS 101889]RAL15484.1 MFS general substrate transporter [Aspergillus homomorphus CBS 101889]
MTTTPDTRGDTQDENAPLLGTDQVPRTSASSSQKLAVMVTASMLILAMDFGFYLTAAPQTKIFEDIVCRNYMAALGNPADAVPTEGVCKSEPVQSELALVNGWKETSDVLPGILLSVPYGVLADRWGRKPVLLLGILGILLGEIWVRVVCLYPTVLPLRLVWLSGMWRLIGGGDIALSSIALVMVADRFPEDEIATALFRLTSAVIVSEVLATPVSAYLMARDPWLPYVLGLGVAIVGSLCAFLMPETLTDARSKIVLTTTPTNEEETPSYPARKDSVRQFIKGKMRELRDSTRFIMSSPGVAVCLFALFVTSISKQSTSLLLQYTSKRFHWSIGNSSLLISLRGLITLANFLLLMPALSFLLTRYLHLPGKLKDLRLAQASSFVSALGFLVIATTASWAMLVLGIVLLSLGAAFAVSCRSFVTALVRPDHVGTLYSSASAVTSFGIVVSGPLLAYAFRLGLRLGPAWFGLPFLLAGGVYLVGSVLLVRLRIPDRVHGE